MQGDINRKENDQLPYTNLISYLEGSKFQEAVESVANQVCKLLNAEMAGVMLYDEKSQELVLQKPAFGEVNDQKIKTFRVPIDGEGVGVSVFRSGIPSISNNAPSNPKVSKRLLAIYPASNLVTFPLEYNSRRIGVIHVKNKKTGEFTQEDLDLLSLVSDHITLLLENSVLYEKERKHSEEIKENYKILSRQQGQLKRLLGIHSKLVKNILNGEGLFAIIFTLAELLNSSVIIEDKHLNVTLSAKNGVGEDQEKICPSESLKSITKEGPMKQYLIEAKAKKKIMFIPPLPEEEIYYHRVLVPLADQHSILGYLSVLYDEDKKIDEFDKIAIEQTALIASLELVKEKNACKIETKLRGELLDDLLEGTYQDSERVLFRARYFNYDLNVPQTVAVARINTIDNRSDYKNIKKIKDHILLTAKKYFKQSLIVEKRNNVIFLIPQHDTENNCCNKLEQLSREVQDKCSTATVMIGVGQFVNDITKIKDSFNQANRVLDIQQKFDFSERVLNYDNLGIFNLLFNVNDTSLLSIFVEEKIGALIVHDQNNNSLLIPTLECYLKNANMKEAAKELYVHVRTVKYRLKKIEEILGVSLTNTEKCLELNVAIKIKKILN